MDRAVELTQEQARDKAVEHLRAEGDLRSAGDLRALLIPAGERTHPNLGRLYDFKITRTPHTAGAQPKAALLAVEAGSATMTLAALGGALINWQGLPKMTLPEAKALVRSFLSRRVKDFDRRNFQRTIGELRGPCWREEFTEKPRDGETSIFENWAVVMVNLEAGRIHYADLSDLRHVRTTKPKLNTDHATARLLKDQATGRQVTNLRLLEDTPDGGRTWRTIYVATLTGPDEDDAPVIRAINADTGEEVA